jgi:hypothetical protein
MDMKTGKFPCKGGPPLITNKLRREGGGGALGILGQLSAYAACGHIAPPYSSCTPLSGSPNIPSCRVLGGAPNIPIINEGVRKCRSNR